MGVIAIKYLEIYFLKLIDGREIAFCDDAEFYEKNPELWFEGDYWEIDCGNTPVEIVNDFKQVDYGHRLIPKKIVESVFKKNILLKEWNEPNNNL